MTMTTKGGRIDVHHHLIPEVYRDDLRRRGVVEVAGRELPEWSPSRSLEVMDRNGIDLSVLSVSAPGVHFGGDSEARRLARQCNEESAAVVAEAPDRFGFFATVPLPDLDGALEECTYALDELHADGIVLLSSFSDGSYLGDPRYEELLAELHRRRAVVFIHPAIPTIAAEIKVDIPVFAMEFTFDTTRAAFNLVHSGALERHPDIKFILSHAGGTVPYLAARFDLLWFQDPELAERAPRGGSAYLRDLYYDTALSANPHALSSLTELVDSSHILFGSDFPFAPEIVTTMSVDGLGAYPELTDVDRVAIDRRTALELLPAVAERLRP
jgi:6-methylsalicylate decarboxylase